MPFSAQQTNDGTVSVVVHGKSPSLFNRLVGGIYSWATAHGHTAIAGFLTRYMGAGEAATALRTGNIPNTGVDGNPRPTHFTSDEPMNDGRVAHISIYFRVWVPQVWIFRPGIPRTSTRPFPVS